MQSVAQRARQHYQGVRDRLRNPPNPANDDGIDLRRDRAIGYIPAYLPLERIAQIVPRKKLLRLNDDADRKPPKVAPSVVVDAPEIRPATPEPEDEPQQQPCIIDIMRVVARRYHLSVLDLKAERRVATIVRPRQLAMYLAYKITLHSTPRIGRAFHRDHTTVLHAIKKITALMKKEPALVAEAEELITEVNEWMAS